MNGQIKFRGKRTDSDHWVYGHYFTTPLTAEYNILPENGAHFDSGLNFRRQVIADENGCVFEVIPETVGRFTGLYDKNGKDIYEGDMLEYEDREVNDCNIVTYKDGSFMLTHGDGSRFFPYHSKIIGSIYGKGDLLKES
jgi:uncharacterized phage protein (TIGR01671 family)